MPSTTPSSKAATSGITKHQGRYAKAFADLKAQGQKAFIPFTLLGWPNRDTSMAIVDAMVDGGATMLELGLAFSDPAADGPIIQQAGVETLATGFNVDDAIALLKEIRAKYSDIPIGLLVYYNMVLARGVDKFCQDMAAAGVDGILIADLPPEMASEVLPSFEAAGLDLIFIVSPLTSLDRLKVIGEQAGGFLYVVSRLGITGTEARYDHHLETLLRNIRQACQLPACVGFGVSEPEHARKMIKLGADGVITGSRVIQIIRDNPDKGASECLTPYIRSMVSAL